MTRPQIMFDLLASALGYQPGTVACFLGTFEDLCTIARKRTEQLRDVRRAVAT